MADFLKVLQDEGYPAEIHEIETSDGYLLSLFRIPFGTSDQTNGNFNSKIVREPVLLVHGLLASAETFVFLGPKRSLGHILADEGYDVWLLNTRGNLHSRKHKKLDPNKDRDYWMFSWSEMGIYDLPATIDYILKETNQNQLFYIGHSQGTTAFFVMAAELPDYNSKIRLMVALAPSALNYNMKQKILRFLAPHHKQIHGFMEKFGLYELIPIIGNNRCRQLLLWLSSNASPLKSLCMHIVGQTINPNKHEFDKSIIPFVLKCSPSGSSAMCAIHYGQVTDSKTFSKYCYGEETNLKKYGSKIPPPYNLDNITAPVVLFYGEIDECCVVQDVALLASKLPNLVENIRVPVDNYSHVDFVFANDNYKILYKMVIDFLRKY